MATANSNLSKTEKSGTGKHPLSIGIFIKIGLAVLAAELTHTQTQRYADTFGSILYRSPIDFAVTIKN